MQIKLNQEERNHIYAFVGGLTYVKTINRNNRRRLAVIARKFGPSSTETITLNQTNLFFLNSLLYNAIEAGIKAKNNEGATEQQRTDIDKTNKIFQQALDKITGKVLNKNVDKGLGLVLGNPESVTLKQDSNEGEKSNESA